MTHEICEGGVYIYENEKCRKCGRHSGQHCGSPLEDQRNQKIRQLQGQIKDLQSLVVDLQNELRRYREREKVQGWAEL